MQTRKAKELMLISVDHAEEIAAAVAIDAKCFLKLVLKKRYSNLNLELGNEIAPYFGIAGSLVVCG